MRDGGVSTFHLVKTVLQGQCKLHHAGQDSSGIFSMYLRVFSAQVTLAQTRMSLVAKSQDFDRSGVITMSISSQRARSYILKHSGDELLQRTLDSLM